MRSKFVIIGGGPTGIGAALRLLELGETDFVMLEANTSFGGLASSEIDREGFTWDFGGHVQFSHYEKFNDYMDLALSDGDWIHHERESWVFVGGEFVPYPFQLNLHRLPPDVRWQCVKGLLDRPLEPQKNASNYQEWIISTFGQGIADVFMIPYNFKVWAHDPKLMNSKWVGDRVAVPDLQSVLRSICLEEDNTGWGPNNMFRFPKNGGTGAIWTSLGGRLPKGSVFLGERVGRINALDKNVESAKGLSVSYEHLISSMPLGCLSLALGDPKVVDMTSGLMSSRVHVVGIGLSGQPAPHLKRKCWMYFPENDLPFYRVTIFSNYSAFNTPEPGRYWSLMAEISESTHKAVDAQSVVGETIRGLMRCQFIRAEHRIVSKWHKVLDPGYPTPSIDRDAIVDELLPRLERKSIYSRGRFGAWKYEVSNQDHSFMQGVEVVDRIVNGRKEQTLNFPDRVNGRLNPFPYEEWVASG